MPRTRRCAVASILLAAGGVLGACGSVGDVQPAPRCGDPVTRDVPGRGSYVLTRLRITSRPALPTLPVFAGQGTSSEAR